MNYLEDLKSYLEVITGENFIKAATYIEAQETLLITYYKSYEEAVEYGFNVSKQDYENYFTQSKIEKLIVEETARLFRKYPFVQVIAIDLKFGGNDFSADVSREKFNSLTQTKLEKLSLDNGTWQEFQKEFTSGVKNAKRNNLFNEFIIK
ncbi:hypothetical protein [Bacillus amyloliquefaciens]|uniref:hypothetical protein n=1 Tax=Bacillus amyloliquefaciens TaxID=1390 RepID=UPI002DB8AE51|nr:hypothetical protein [Bacillus amyloliquefaciens]MEC3841745.1 hypothetical protein [Bacillus amyloliquefaciens]